MSTPPWSRFGVGRPSRPPLSAPDCKPLEAVAHVAHVPAAVRITEDRRLRADLVFDDSKLNTERIRVVWLSPNDWEGAGGYRYGNVKFEFDWAALIEGKRSYWVESIPYRPPACRILLTDVDRSGTLDTYDPTAGDGPWWQSPSGEHYWNGECCLEVMLEDDLDLDRVTKVDFVSHHARRCSIDHRTCRYRGTADHVGGAEFIAATVSRRLPLELPGVVVDRGKGLEPEWRLDKAVSTLLTRVAKVSAGAGGSVERSHSSAGALARALLEAYANPDIEEDVGEIAAHFASADDAEGAVADAVAAAVGLPNATPFLFGRLARLRHHEVFAGGGSDTGD